MAHQLLRGLRGAVKNLVPQRHSRPVSHFINALTRNCMTEKPNLNSAFVGSIVLRFIQDEIQYELDHLPAFEPKPEFNSFIFDGRPGEQWIRLSKNFEGNEHIKIDATMFEKVPMKKTDDEPDDSRLQISLIIDVFKSKDADVMEFLCTARQDRIVIRKVYVRRHYGIKDQSYIGPQFRELSDDLKDSLYDFLEDRGIDDDLAEYLHLYMKKKDKMEYLHWMENLKSFIEK